MKKFYLNCTIMAMLLGGMTTVSCGDEEPEDNETPDTPITPTDPDKDKALSSVEQKERMEAIALEFMEQMPSDDFKNLGELADYVLDTYCTDDYDWNEVEEWADDILDAAAKATGVVRHEEEFWDGWMYNEYYKEYKSLLFASNFTGTFTARAGKWTYSKSDDLKFIFNDKQGQECVLKLTTGGNVKKVHAFNIEDWQDYDYDYEGNVSNNFYNYTQYTIGVPEKIDVTLTQGSTQLVRTAVRIDLSSISGEEFDLSRNSLTASAEVEMNNGYKWEVSDVAYTANTKASTKCTMSKNGKQLITVAVAGDVSGIPSCNVSAFSEYDFDIDDYNTDKATAKNAFVKVDILGKMQMQGVITDVRKYAEYLEDAYDNDESESMFKSYINQANALSDISLFYDNSAVKQADIMLEPFAETDWSYTYWEAEPVIKFYDGSSYSSFEAFFNDRDFKNVIDTFKSLANRYADMVNERIEW